MAIGRPLIFEEIEIQDAGGGAASTFDKHLVDSATINIEEESSMIDDGQTLTDYYDINFEVNLYDDTVLSDTRVYSNAAEEPIKADLLFKRAPGGATVRVPSVIINGRKQFDGNRVQYRLMGSKRGVDLSDVVDVQTV